MKASNAEQRKKLQHAPKGMERLKWLGPAFIWMLSAAGSGELLFTPRIAAQYGYTLVWALILAVAMKWFINREIGRYTVCTGATFFRGLATLPNSRWMLWVILVPQLVVAVATIAGLAGAASTAVVVAFDVPLWLPSLFLIGLTASIIALGKFKSIEKLTTILAIVISLSILTAALATSPDLNKLSEGFVPSVSENIKMDEVLSWLGFMLAGAAGLMWFSYWTKARGYGAASLQQQEPINPEQLSSDDQHELKGWIKYMTIANSLAIVGALIIAFAFLILGTELLQPKGLLPEENKVAEVLGQLMGGIWGRIGFWYMIAAVFVTFISTMLSDQDGFGRMFADGAAILIGHNKKGIGENTHRLKQWFVIILLALIPAITYLFAGEPVQLLKIAGVIEAAHIPFVTALILYLNNKSLPVGLKPGTFSNVGCILAGITFTVFAVVYILQLTGVF